MKSLLEQPALEKNEENPDDEDLDSNDDEDLDSNDSEDSCESHGEEDDDISLHDIWDKDEEMNRHAKDLAFLDWFGKEF